MNRLEIDVDNIGPELIGHRLETTTIDGHRVGIRLARYEVLQVDGQPLYHLYSDPAPVTVKVKPGTPLKIAAQAPAQPTTRPAHHPPAQPPVAPGQTR